MHLSATFTGKRPQKSDAGIKDAFEEMEHEFPFETFRPRKQGRFPINQNVRFEFRQHPLANGTTFSKIFKKVNLARHTQNFWILFPGISRIFG